MAANTDAERNAKGRKPKARPANSARRRKATGGAAANTEAPDGAASAARARGDADADGVPPAAPDPARTAGEGAETASAPEPAKRPRNRWSEFFSDPCDAPRPTASEATLAQVAEGYLAALAAAGGGGGTVLGYRLDLALALRVLGADAPVAGLTEDAVAAMFESDPVTRTRSGRPKARVGIDKTRRVFRQAMDWAVKNGILAATPVPERYRIRRNAKGTKPAAGEGDLGEI